MTAPDGSSPDGSLAVGLFAARQAKTAEEAKAEAVGGALGGFGHAQESWWGLESDVSDLADEITDGQLDLEERIDLLEGVHGYCNLFMSKNWNVASQTKVQLPFDVQLGPNIGAEPFSNGIKLATKGLWRADLLLTFAQSPPGNPWSAGAYIEVYNHVSGLSYSESLFALVVTQSGPETAAFSKTFVIPADDTYMVRAHVWQGTTTRRGIFGGTTMSALSVNKWSNNTDHNVVLPDAPDGGDLG